MGRLDAPAYEDVVHARALPARDLKIPRTAVAAVNAASIPPLLVASFFISITGAPPLVEPIAALVIAPAFAKSPSLFLAPSLLEPTTAFVSFGAVPPVISAVLLSHPTPAVLDSLRLLVSPQISPASFSPRILLTGSSLHA